MKTSYNSYLSFPMINKIASVIQKRYQCTIEGDIRLLIPLSGFEIDFDRMFTTVI